MNSKNLIEILTVCCLVALCCSCEKTVRKADVDEQRLASITPPKEMPDMPRPSGGLALSYESTAITADEIIEPIRQQADELAQKSDFQQFSEKIRPVLGSILVQKIGDIKLYEKAKAALPENIDQEIIDKIVEQEVQKFIAQNGGNYAAAEQELKKMGTNWKDFYKQQRRAILVQSFISEEVKMEKPITHSELLDYYKKMKDQFSKEALIEFSLIDLDINKILEPNELLTSAKQRAETLAGKLVADIKQGKDFAELAKKYSNDSTAKDGGRWKPVRPGSLAAPYDVIETAAEKLEIGQVSEPIDSQNHIFIVKLENKQAASCETFEQVQQQVESRLRFEQRRKAVDDMMTKIISQVDMSYADSFIDYCVEKAYQDAIAKKDNQ